MTIDNAQLGPGVCSSDESGFGFEECGFRVLVIDDREIDAYVVIKQLKAAIGGVECDIVKERTDLVSRLEKLTYDVVVCDYLLGGWTAIDAVRQCRASGWMGPFIVISSSVGEEVAADCIKNGANDFLLKSHISRLPTLVSRALELRKEQLRAESAQAELQRAEQRFRALIENSSDCVDVLDVDGTILWISPACLSILGFETEELVGKAAFDFIAPEHRARAANALRLCIETNAPVRLEFRCQHKSGRWIDLEVIARSHISNPAIQGVICNFREITERKLAEEALQNSEKHLRALFESALDGILVLDADETVIDANPSACNMFGKSRLQLLSSALDNLAEKRSDAARFHNQLINTPAFRSELSVVCEDTSRKILDASVTSNFLPGRHLFFLRDVTEQRQLEDNLRRSSRLEAIGRLAGGVAHDFNNLLMVITSYAELMSDIVDKESPIGGFVSEIQKASQRAASLTHQLLAFSRKQVLSPTVVDVNEVFIQAGSMLRRIIGEDIRLVMSLSEDLKPIVADRAQLEQVIVNLAVNARDAMPNGGTFRITTVNDSLADTYNRYHESIRPPKGDYARIDVRDEGEGIPEDIQGRVFEPFFTTKPNGMGTGLGLATVYGIVKQSGGFIFLDSQPGQGTVFTIYFPIAQCDKPEAPREQAEPTRWTGTDSILLVEDEEQMLEAVSSYLKSKGYKVLEANRAEQALEIARSTDEIDILITDVIMPGMNGRMLAREFSTIHPGANVIYMTGYTDPAWAHENTIAEDRTLLRKPFKLDRLVEIIHHLEGPRR